MLTVAEIGGWPAPRSNGCRMARSSRSATAWTASAVLEALDEDDELVAPEPGDGAVPAGDRLQPAADLDQQGVADLVPERVVHGLEPVDVEQQHADRRGLALKPRERRAGAGR